MKYILYLHRHKKKIIFILCFLSLYILKLFFDFHTFNKTYRLGLKNRYEVLSHDRHQKESLLKKYTYEKKALVSDTFYQEKVAREELFLLKKGDVVFRI